MNDGAAFNRTHVVVPLAGGPRKGDVGARISADDFAESDDLQLVREGGRSV